MMRCKSPKPVWRTVLLAWLALGVLACGWSLRAEALSCGGSGEFEPPLGNDEFLHQAYSPASGHDRVTLFQVPASAPASDRVLVMLLHGGGDDDLEELLSSMRDTGWPELAAQQGIVLAYPTGSKDPQDPTGTYNWNDGRLGTDIWPMPDHADIDDVGYLAEVMDIAQRDFAVGQRIYVMGISNGGMMALRLAGDSRTRGRIRAMATVVAQLPLDRAAQPLAALPSLLINATRDPLIPFRGGEILTQLETAGGAALGAPIYGGEVISFRSTLRRVLTANGCSLDKQSRWLADGQDDGTRVLATRYCGTSAKVQTVVVAGGGHRWQGRGGNQAEDVRPCYSVSLNGLDLNYYIRAGLSTQDGFDATVAAWRFFQRH